MTTTDTRPLTIADVLDLNVILTAAQRCSHIRWLNRESGAICEGVARCIAHDQGGFLSADEDVRDGFLHVSGIGEQWIPVGDLMKLVREGGFAVDDR